MKKRILIYPEYWLPHVFSLIRGLGELNDPDVEIYWTNKKWYRPSFGAFENAKCLPLHDAMKSLNEGFFDALVVADGTAIGYLTNHLREKTIRFFLDTSDTKYINRSYLYFADKYLKCQHPEGIPLVGDQTTLEEVNSTVPVYPFSYCSSYPIPQDILTKQFDVKPVVHFRGWAGTGNKRIEVLTSLKEAGIPVIGGLHHREELPINVPIPNDLQSERIEFKDYIEEMMSCQIALNLAGNGEMCFRTYEIWECGVCMVSQKIQIKFPGPAPKDKRDWLVGTSTDEIVTLCKTLLDSPETCQNIGEAGRNYWKRFASPEFTAKRFLSMLD